MIPFARLRHTALALGAVTVLACFVPAHAAVLTYDFSTGSGGFTPVQSDGIARPFTYNASMGQWQVAGISAWTSSSLNGPAFTVTDGGPVRVAFTHFYDFQDGFDGAVLQVSVNGGGLQQVGTNVGVFVQGGYDKVIRPDVGSAIRGVQAWTGSSGGVLESIAELGSFEVGTSLDFSWLAAWDNTINRPFANWAIQSITLSDGPSAAAVPLPGTLPLVLLALGACGFTVSRRPAAAMPA
jgi:hypothetical protein